MISPPFLLYLGAGDDPLAVKTARGVATWRPEDCLGERRPGPVSLGLPQMSAAEAAAAGARTMIVGVANRGGTLTALDVAEIVAALEAGLDVASGLHQRLRDRPEIRAAAARAGRRLIDVRDPPPGLTVGTGERRAGFRVLTVGTDCSAGKMYASLALTHALRRRGLAADFRATGQTGILIAGAGVPVDAVPADFISGAIEQLSPPRHDGGWDVIEGQGSLFHPSYAGVSLGLLHGAQPDALVLCHEPGRRAMRGLSNRPLPEPGPCLAANLEAARLTSPAVRAVGVALNTSRLDDAEAAAVRTRIANETGLPVQDPVKDGVELIVDRMLECCPGLPRAANAGR